MDDTGAPFAAEAGGVRIAIRLVPRAHRDGIDGVVAGADRRAALQVRLTAAPVDNAANIALVAFLAAALGVRRAMVELRSGATSRHKILFVAGAPAPLLARLAALSPAPAPGPPPAPAQGPT